MSNNLGDFAPAAVIYGKFTTKRPTTAAGFTLAGTPALSVYKDNSTAQSTSGVTLTVDFDGITGLNHFTVDTSSDGTFYAAGGMFDIVITTGTVDSVSAVGYTVGQFTLNAASVLRSTVGARTLDVTATGAAGIDWGNVENKTTANLLTGTEINATTEVDTVNDKTGYALTSGERDSIADAYLDRDMAAGTDTGTNSTVKRTPRQALRVLRNKVDASTGVMTVTKEDDTTADWTAGLTGDASSAPVVTVDPS